MLLLITHTIVFVVDIKKRAFKRVVLASKSDKTTPSLARSFKRRSLFDAQSGCISWRRVRGSQCARFEVHTVDGNEDMSNLLLLVCYKGGALWDYHTTIYLLL